MQYLCRISGFYFSKGASTNACNDQWRFQELDFHCIYFSARWFVFMCAARLSIYPRQCCIFYLHCVRSGMNGFLRFWWLYWYILRHIFGQRQQLQANNKDFYDVHIIQAVKGLIFNLLLNVISLLFIFHNLSTPISIFIFEPKWLKRRVHVCDEDVTTNCSLDNLLMVKFSKNKCRHVIADFNILFFPHFWNIKNTLFKGNHQDTTAITVEKQPLSTQTDKCHIM